jgi:hypothetical protein
MDYGGNAGSGHNADKNPAMKGKISASVHFWLIFLSDQSPQIISRAIFSSS